MIRLEPDLKADFPIFDRLIHDHRLTYLDSAATSQKPRQVIDAELDFYQKTNSNILRSVHTLAEEATAGYERVRGLTAAFIAGQAKEIIFTRGTTESINLVARGYGDSHIGPGDNIVVSAMEHHSNLIPWQQLAKRRGATLRFVELQADGSLSIESAAKVIDKRTKIVAMTQVSNVLGTIVPIPVLADLAHAAGAILVVDGAQSVPHQPTDVSAMGADFLAFSAHKMCGPTGVGVLWGKMEHLEAMDPVLYGGEMIAYVDRQQATWADIPTRFEGGTPNIAGVIGFGAAIEYLNQVGMANIARHGSDLAEMAYQRLKEIPGVAVYGPDEKRGALVSFNIDAVHPHDVAQALDAVGVAVRAGHHCAQPLMRWLGVAATARASFYLYNDADDVERLVDAIHSTKRYFQR